MKIKRIKNFDGDIIVTYDTHYENYMETQEGKNLPVKHCIKDTPGWQIHPELESLRKTEAIDKLTFGSSALPAVLAKEESIVSCILYGSFAYSR